MEETLFSELKKYGECGTYPYHMPGHKRNISGFKGMDFSKIDITEIDGFDNLHNPKGILEEAQNNLRNLCGSDYSYFLVNGSTVGVLAAISAAVNKGGKVIIPRNAHKSTYNGLILRDADPVFIYPKLIPGFNTFEAVSVDDIRTVLTNNSDISAVVVVSPTYEGRIADIKAIADLLHENDIPLIVDEAHGAHLSFAEGIDGYGKSAVRCGADVVIQSVHKTLPAPTQTAVLHVNGDRVSHKKIEDFLNIYETSSPSYPLMAGIDYAVRLMSEYGKNLLENLKYRYTKLIESLKDCHYISVLPIEPGIQDIGKLVISANKAGISGKDLSDILRDRFRLELEMATRDYCLAMFTVGDSAEGYQRMEKALLTIDKEICEGILGDTRDNPFENSENNQSEEMGLESALLGQTESGSWPFSHMESDRKYSIADAWEMDKEEILLSKSIGRCAGDMISLYPPGVPILIPGEEITPKHIDTIFRYIDLGLEVTGLYIDNKNKDSVKIQVILND